MEKINILAGRILVKPDKKEDVTAGGIIIPNAKKANRGVVVERGDNLHDIKMELKIGDVVVYPENTGTDVEILDIGYVLMEQRSVHYFVRPTL